MINKDAATNLQNHNKQTQLLLDLQVLSSLKNKQFFNQPPSKKIIPPQNKILNSQITQTDLQSLTRSFQANHDNNYIVPASNFSNNNSKNQTNLSFYQEPFMFESNKNNTILSYQFDLNSKDMKVTNESFYQTLFTPFKTLTNMSYKPEPGAEGLHQSLAKKESTSKNEPFDDVNTNSSNSESENDVNSSNGDTKFLGKKQVFINYKNKANGKNINLNGKESNQTFFRCKHKGCNVCYRTKKQISAHHNRMNPKCKSDTVKLLDGIRKAKIIILTNEKLKCLVSESLKEKYQKTMAEITFEEHVQIICGFLFDEIPKND